MTRGNTTVQQARTTVGALATTALLGALVAPAAVLVDSTPATAAPNPAYKILKHLEYSGPGKASLRVGYYDRAADKGFGWNKVKKKHNITKYSAVEYIAKSPNRDRVGNTTTYHMTGYAGKYRCRNGVCTLVKQYKMILSVNEKIQRDNQDKGVITMYCVGTVWCPNWVSKALADANRSARAAVDEDDPVIPESEAPDNTTAPEGEVTDEADLADENTPTGSQSPGEGDETDGTETYSSSYEPLRRSVSAATLSAATASASGTAFKAGHGTSKWTMPSATAEDRYRYIGSYTPLR
ncbi:hypothetical protein [Streptomyces sp. NBC_01538]|uniref:hypothetical protein n=1 Tax=Streptomyces sp. NBC_01538 TaxID=2903897 RepID=UPI00386CE887